MIFELEKYLNECNEIAQRVFFINSQNPHPIYEDSNDVFAKAKKQILTEQMQDVAGEILAFIGVQTPLPMLYSLGFLVSEKYIFIQTKASMFDAAGSADLIRLGSGDESSAYEIFDQKCEYIVPDEMKSAMKKVLNEVLQIISKLSTDKNFQAQSLNLDQALAEFSLSGVLLKPSDEAKILKKANKVFDLLNVKFFALDEMIFSLSKPFGVIIDEKGLASRDLGEDAIYSSWDDISKYRAKMHEDSDKIVVSDICHTLPTQLCAVRENFIAFLNLIAENIINKGK